MSILSVHIDTEEGLLFYDRLNKFRKENENDAQFAERLGVSRQVLRNWKSRINHTPKRRVFVDILDRLDIAEVEFWCPCDRCDKALQR